MGIDAIADFLRRHSKSRIVLAGHQRPDGDSLGSCLGLAGAMREQGFDVLVANPSPLGARLGFLVDDRMIARFTGPDWHGNFDCLGVLDCGDAERLDPLIREGLPHLPAFNIDHHVSSSGVGQAIWVEPEAGSTGEMVVRLCRALGWPLPRHAARALWTAIVTDTGRFSYGNTSPSCLLAAEACLRAGADPVEVATRIFQTVSFPERKLQALVINRMELLEGGRLAVSWLSPDDFRMAGIGVEESHGMVNLLRETEGVAAAVFLCDGGGAQDGGGRAGVKVSLRTAVPHNALDVVTRFGGGGHMRAAGCTVAMPLQEAKRRVTEAAAELFFRTSTQPESSQANN